MADIHKIKTQNKILKIIDIKDNKRWHGNKNKKVHGNKGTN